MNTARWSFGLCRRAGMSLEEAQKLIQRRRPQAVPIPAFVDMLKEYEQNCRSLGAISDKKKVAAARTMGAGPPRPRGANVGPQLPTAATAADITSETEVTRKDESTAGTCPPSTTKHTHNNNNNNNNNALKNEGTD